MERVPKRVSVREFKLDIFVSSEIRRMNSKSKSGKKSQDISVRWKVSDWVGDLHTDKNNVWPTLKPFSFLNCFSGILHILLA